MNHFMKDNLRKAQLHEVELLKKFKEICENENLEYYLLGGTTLGAIRHKGFIPWDDDIDVGLVRCDYNKFIKISQNYFPSNMKLEHWTIDSTYQDYTMKLVDTDVEFITERYGESVAQNVWIDIFPLDGVPQKGLLREFHYLKLKYYRMLLGFHYIEKERMVNDRATYKKIIYGIAKRIPLGNVINPIKVKRKLDKQLSKYSLMDVNYIGNLMGAYHEREVFPKKWFKSGNLKAVLPFEGEKYVVPFETDNYLSHQYGNYMKLPPLDKQKPKHDILEVKFHTIA